MKIGYRDGRLRPQKPIFSGDHFYLRENMQGIYIIRNKVNQKIYVGSSCHVKERWKQHQCALKGNWHNNKYLQNSYNKYGKENFDFLLVEIVENEDDLIQIEQWYYAVKPENSLL